MGTMIELALGNLEVDWGKNSHFIHHGELFQECDLKEIPLRRYGVGADSNSKPHIVHEEGFGKPLHQVADRVELLGYTIFGAKQEYSLLHKNHDMKEGLLPFETLSEALRLVDVNKVSGNYSDDYDPGEFVRHEIIDRLGLSTELDTFGARADHWEIDLLLENFHPYSSLRLLAENPANLDLDVSWAFGELVENGWAERETFVARVNENNRFLIVTEGSSDAKILRHALKILKPHVADFFRFVDMEEGYPFSGTGNLHRFTQGLVSIGLQNQTLILYDNDAEGVAKLKEAEKLNLPANMRIISLPDCEEFRNFPTIGPDGEATSDINGRAASIECYLDLEYKMRSKSKVRWSSYVGPEDCYQGAIENKTALMKTFLNLREQPDDYDFSRLSAALDTLVLECVGIAEEVRFQQFS